MKRLGLGVLPGSIQLGGSGHSFSSQYLSGFEITQAPWLGGTGRGSFADRVSNCTATPPRPTFVLVGIGFRRLAGFRAVAGRPEEVTAVYRLRAGTTTAPLTSNELELYPMVPPGVCACGARIRRDILHRLPSRYRRNFRQCVCRHALRATLRSPSSSRAHRAIVFLSGRAGHWRANLNLITLGSNSQTLPGNSRRGHRYAQRRLCPGSRSL